ncbi:MAG TPA: Ig-like domain-containing protein, partial [Bryobacteraceae bacterium]|nr:Ig-like domain-containing protein [Bryobacteraceae bacterium]
TPLPARPAAPTSGTGTPPPASRRGQPPSAAPPSVPGGSEVYRIDPSGTPRRVWNHPQEIVYSIGFDAEGRVLLGSGNKGNIYRIDSDTFYTALLNAPPNQITALYAAPNGHLFAASGNVGKVYEIGPGVEPEGWIESDVLDAGMYSLWGRLSFEAVLHGGSVTLTARSGNLDQPQKNWSSWTAPITATKGARLTAPPARFLQWKAVLKAASAEQSPALESVDVAYLPKNLAPRVEEIEITPSNYKFPAQAVLPPPTPTLSLPPMRKRPQNSTTLSVSVDSSSTPSMQYAKGFLGTRWTASDENGDNLLFTVQIRGSNEKEWKPLKEKIRERYLSWDSTAFPDGEYRIRIIASDLPSNPPAEALEDSSESNPFVIDNTPPQIIGLTATATSGKLNVRWKASDALNTIKRAEYSLDGGEWTIVAPTSLLSDSTEEDYDLTISNVASGEHTIAVRVVDDYDNEGIGKAVVQ